MQAQHYIDLVKSTLDALDPKALEALVKAFPPPMKRAETSTPWVMEALVPQLPMPQEIS